MKRVSICLRNAAIFILGMISFVIMPSNGISGELYPSGDVRTYQQFDILESGATGSGFAIFQGGRPWRIAVAKVTKNNMDIGISSLLLISPIRNEYFAEMAITLSLGGGDTSARTYFRGEPCAPSVNALIKINKGVGKSDNCLTIKPLTVNIQGKSTPTMEIKVRNSQSSSRLYDIQLLLALDKLGFPNSNETDWSPSQINNDAPRKQFIEKISAWGGQLQDAVNLALAFSKPQDAFQKVPSIDTLVTIEPVSLVQPMNAVQTEALRQEVTEQVVAKLEAEKQELARQEALLPKSSSNLPAYSSLIVKAIKPNIIWPDINEPDGRCEVEIEVNDQGNIVGHKILKEDGNLKWCPAVIRALDRTERLPFDSDGRVPNTLVVAFLARQ